MFSCEYCKISKNAFFKHIRWLLLNGALSGLRHSLATVSPLKNDVLFHCKSTFCSQDILNFCRESLFIKKNGSIRKIRLISKFISYQPGKQTIAIHITLDISRSKSNQTMKFGQLMKLT